MTIIVFHRHYVPTSFDGRRAKLLCRLGFDFLFFARVLIVSVRLNYAERHVFRRGRVRIRRFPHSDSIANFSPQLRGALAYNYRPSNPFWCTSDPPGVLKFNFSPTALRPSPCRRAFRTGSVGFFHSNFTVKSG